MRKEGTKEGGKEEVPEGMRVVCFFAWVSWDEHFCNYEKKKRKEGMSNNTKIERRGES